MHTHSWGSLSFFWQTVNRGQNFPCFSQSFDAEINVYERHQLLHKENYVCEFSLRNPHAGDPVSRRVAPFLATPTGVILCLES